MKKSVSIYNTLAPASNVVIDSSLKERKLTEDNSFAIRSKMNIARLFMKENGLLDLAKVSKK